MSVIVSDEYFKELENNYPVHISITSIGDQFANKLVEIIWNDSKGISLGVYLDEHNRITAIQPLGFSDMHLNTAEDYSSDDLQKILSHLLDGNYTIRRTKVLRRRYLDIDEVR